MKKTVITVLIILLLTLSLSSQGIAESPTTNTEYAVATDANGRVVHLQEQPTSVMVAGKAAIMPANALFLFPEVETMDLELSVTDQGLGDLFTLLRPSLKDQERIAQNASVEEIASRNPQLVLIKATHFESIGKKLDQLGVPNFTLSLETYAEWKQEITELGFLLHNPSRAQEVVNVYENRLKAVTDTVAPLRQDEKVRVLVLQGSQKDNTSAFSIAPDTWMQTWMVEQAGAEPVWKGATGASNGWSTVSFEQIAAWNPEVIYIVNYRGLAEPFVTEIYNSTLWSELDAVRNNRVVSTPSDVMSYMQPAANWILGLEWMAKDLYPTLFATMDMDQQVRSFYQKMYNLNDEAIMNQLVDLFHASLTHP